MLLSAAHHLKPTPWMRREGLSSQTLSPEPLNPGVLGGFEGFGVALCSGIMDPRKGGFLGVDREIQGVFRSWSYFSRSDYD